MSEVSAFMQSAYSYQILCENHYSAYLRRGSYVPPEDACWYTAHRLCLAPTIITHGMANMVREVHFESRDYYYLNAGTSAYLFVQHKAAAAERLQLKAWL